jgi:hypothetical protein
MRKNFLRALEVENISWPYKLNDKADIFFLIVTQWNMTWQRTQNCSISTNINSWIFTYHKTPLTEQDIKYKHNRIIMNYTAKRLWSLCFFYDILEGQKEIIKKPLEHTVPSWDSNPAPPKLASHISVKSSHLMNSVSHAHSMWKYGTGFVWKSNSVMGKQT